MPDLVLNEVSKSFSDVRAMDSVSLTVEDGEFFTLLGPSGCGKSTTLATIAGLEPPDSGSIHVGDRTFADAAKGKFLSPEERNLGMVFQSYALWPHLSVSANVALPLRLRRASKAERRQRVNEVLGHVGLTGLGERYPHQLSGGQQQRVALARALVYAPTVLLLDEPLSNLDAKLRDRARTWLKRLQADVGITTVYVTHDQLEALSLSDRIAVMGDGKVLQLGTPREIYERPETAEVAAFLGHCNFLRGRVRGRDPSRGELLVELATGVIRVHAISDLADGEEVTIGVRSERLQVQAGEGPGDDLNVLPMRLENQSYVGARYEYQLSYDGDVVQVEGTTELIGPEVRVVVPAGGCVLFPGRDTAGATPDELTTAKEV